ncbi:DegV family protein [Acidaminobacter sp. JC074]|uniref:DegV family protein n=1 Tax=Acidaminobacter sp. JC074 TaxID=2530199 RepID=UPI001F108E21|nr:DegV family protein [Acidaminobacter sp. JC074]MCH4888858.1 DegV family protein [Acidaminobacter sp. JC074]
MAVKILTDSGCDLPKSITDSLNIEVMPLIVYLNDEEHYDGEVDPKFFFDSMRKGAKTRTAQITAPMFEETFTRLAETGDDVLYIAFSSGLSGTYQTSELVKNDLLSSHPEYKIHIIDSKAASIGFGLVVYYAGKLAQEGKSIDEIIKATEFNCKHMEHIFTVDDLEYLYRGGRVSRGAAVMGSMLNIKPILDVEDGKLIPVQKIRSRKKAMKRMVEMMGERGVNLDKQMIAINHGDDLEAAESLKAMITEKYGCNDFIVNYVGCVIGAHSGPGTLSVFFLNEIK